MEVDASFVEIEVDIPKGTQRIGFESALLVAGIWVNTGRTAFKLSPAASEIVADRWNTHPDRKIIAEWLACKGAPSDFAVLYFVSVHVIAEWLDLPKRTRTQHRKLFVQIEETAKQLASLLAETEEMYYRGGGYGLRHALVCDLFTDKESDDIVASVGHWIESHPEEMDDGTELVINPRNMFPDMEELLQRLSSAANRIAKAGPIHSQPNKRGALKGFFVRRMEGLLLQRYGEVSTEVLAAIVTIALNEATDRELVAKLLK